MMDATILLLGSYIFLGGSIKYLDRTYDERAGGKRKALLLMPLCGLLMAALITLDRYSAIILIGLMLGNLMAGKINTREFQIMVVIALAPPLAISYLVPDITQTPVFAEVLGVPIVLITISAMIDEKLNDFSDRKKLSSTIGNLLYHRLLLPVTVLILCFAGYFSLVYFISLVGFDVAYKIVDRYH